MIFRTTRDGDDCVPGKIVKWGPHEKTSLGEPGGWHPRVRSLRVLSYATMLSPWKYTLGRDPEGYGVWRCRSSLESVYWTQYLGSDVHYRQLSICLYRMWVCCALEIVVKSPKYIMQTCPGMTSRAFSLQLHDLSRSNHLIPVFYMFWCVFVGPSELLRVPELVSEIKLNHRIFML